MATPSITSASLTPWAAISSAGQVDAVAPGVLGDVAHDVDDLHGDAEVGGVARARAGSENPKTCRLTSPTAPATRSQYSLSAGKSG